MLLEKVDKKVLADKDCEFLKNYNYEIANCYILSKMHKIHQRTQIFLHKYFTWYRT